METYAVTIHNTESRLCTQGWWTLFKGPVRSSSLLKLLNSDPYIDIYVTIKKRIMFICFSSPEPKAQVSFSNQNLFFVRRRRKNFTFPSSSPEPLGQFQQNLAQIIFG